LSSVSVSLVSCSTSASTGLAAGQPVEQLRQAHGQGVDVPGGKLYGDRDRGDYTRRGGPLLVPPLHDPVMFIDVRDLAEWTIHLAEQRLGGPYNAVGPAEVLTMGEMLRQVGEATGRRARLIEASQAFLDAHQVAPWSELPVWLPGHGDTAGFHRRSHTRALQAGLRFRPLAQTTADLLAWWDTLDDMRRATLRAGLGPEREAELLARL
jgi:2'-hydroxyisoflavone reductase